jgi:hypothetical protein
MLRNSDSDVAREAKTSRYARIGLGTTQDHDASDTKVLQDGLAHSRKSKSTSLSTSVEM